MRGVRHVGDIRMASDVIADGVTVCRTELLGIGAPRFIMDASPDHG